MNREHAGPCPGHSDAGPKTTAPTHNHFSTCKFARTQQAVAWRNHIPPYLDVAVSRAQVAGGFRGTINSYRTDGMMFLDCCTDPLMQSRTAARISTDGMRDYVFHVLVDGGIETATGLYPQRKALQSRPGILALDMNQPMRMQRPRASRMLAFLLPRALMEAMLPEAESLHGRVIDHASPLARLFLGELGALSRNIGRMGATEMRRKLTTCAHLIAAAFGRQFGLDGDARAAIRTMKFGKVRRYVKDNLHESGLSPDSVLGASRLSRATLYRLFEHEGGLATYIRNRRLREAADELVRFPHAPVMEIAYGLGFSSAVDFNHAFRRAYDMAPGDFRNMAATLQSPLVGPQARIVITP